MRLSFSRLLRLLAGAAAFAAISAVAFALAGHGGLAQTARTVKVVVPFPPGGPADSLARILIEQIGRAHGPKMVIENDREPVP